jgi:PIN domain nuclease of toxin-antitoxin system
MSGNLALLLDTHILAWVASGGKRLTASLMNQLALEPLFVSAVIAFEYEDLRLRGRFDDDVSLAALQDDLGFDLLDFPATLSADAAALPPIHRDPVDRMLVAHAMSTGMTLVTADGNIHKYAVPCIA